MAFANSIAPKTLASELNRAFARKLPAAIASESAQAAFEQFVKPQVKLFTLAEIGE